MPFVAHSVTTKAAGADIKANLRARKSGPAVLHLHLTVEATVKLSLTEGDRLDVMIGTGPESGRIRLRREGGAGAATLTRCRVRGGSYYRVNLGHIPQLGSERRDSAPCKWSFAEDGWIDILLPWQTAPFKIDPPTRPSLPAARTRLELGRPPLGSRLMSTPKFGDPPPERSALAHREEVEAEQSRLRHIELEGRRSSEEISRSIRRQEREEEQDLRFTPAEREVAKALSRGRRMSSHSLADVAHTKATSVKVFVSHLRRKLRRVGIGIESNNRGYLVNKEAAQRLAALV